MRKTTFVGTLSCCISLFCLATLSMICQPVFAQDAASAAAPVKDAPAVVMPSDPKELMLLAAKANGLTGDDTKPWHLKASWKLLDNRGGIRDQGTYEEFWASPKKFRRTFTGATFTQSYYRTDENFLRSGVQKLPSELISDVRRELVEPMPDERIAQYMSFNVRPNQAGDIKLSCLSLDDKSIYRAPYYLIGRSFCLDTEKPILRISTSDAESAQFIHSNFQEFQGYIVSGDLNIFQDGKLALTAHLENIEALGTTEETGFTPPPDAIPVPRMITISSGVAQGFLLKHQTPVYPVGASSVGTVIVWIEIDTGGRVVDAEFLAGPPELKATSLNCVRKWTYKPYLLNGQPVEVHTTVNMVFSR